MRFEIKKASAIHFNTRSKLMKNRIFGTITADKII